MSGFLLVKLTGWNDGVDNVTLVNQDETSLFYLSSKGKTGAVGKKYITEIKVLGEDGPEVEKQAINYFDFINKVVNINLFEKNFLEAFFGKGKEFFEVTVTAVSDSLRESTGFQTRDERNHLVKLVAHMVDDIIDVYHVMSDFHMIAYGLDC